LSPAGFHAIPVSAPEGEILEELKVVDRETSAFPRSPPDGPVHLRGEIIKVLAGKQPTEVGFVTFRVASGNSETGLTETARRGTVVRMYGIKCCDQGARLVSNRGESPENGKGIMTGGITPVASESCTMSPVFTCPHEAVEECPVRCVVA
jgi:hypothetical protein